jgi:hypothetical protein
MQYSVNTEHFVFWSNGYMFQPRSAQSSGHTTTKGVNFFTVIVVWPDDGPDEGLKHVAIWPKYKCCVLPCTACFTLSINFKHQRDASNKLKKKTHFAQSYVRCAKVGRSPIVAELTKRKLNSSHRIPTHVLVGLIFTLRSEKTPYTSVWWIQPKALN